MKYILTILMALSISGCATITNLIPSFWDDNQSKVAVDIKYNITNINCKSDNLLTALILEDINWFISYSESKGTNDVIKIITPLKSTLVSLDEKVKNNTVTPTYCELKKKILITQSDKFAKVVLGRY